MIAWRNLGRISPVAQRQEQKSGAKGKLY